MKPRNWIGGTLPCYLSGFPWVWRNASEACFHDSLFKETQGGDKDAPLCGTDQVNSDPLTTRLIPVPAPLRRPYSPILPISSRKRSMGVERPTHPRLHVRHVYDAHKILEAVRIGQLRLVSRRLNETERHNYICSGSVFVWEESDEENGLKRWTDGKAFGQSRMRGDFLFYEEKTDTSISRLKATTTMWSSSVMRAEQGYPFAPSEDQDPMALVKQTYSAFFMGPGDRHPRKWHMTAYFTYADLPNLPNLDMDPILRHIQVPSGLYRSGKARSRPSLESDSTPPKVNSPLPQYQPWTPLRAQSPPETCRQMSSRSLSPSMNDLPSLHTFLGSGSGRPRSGSRLSEDQRLIRLLNSNTIL